MGDIALPPEGQPVQPISSKGKEAQQLLGELHILKLGDEEVAHSVSLAPALRDESIPIVKHAKEEILDAPLPEGCGALGPNHGVASIGTLPEDGVEVRVVDVAKGVVVKQLTEKREHEPEPSIQHQDHTHHDVIEKKLHAEVDQTKDSKVSEKAYDDKQPAHLSGKLHTKKKEEGEDKHSVSFQLEGGLRTPKLARVEVTFEEPQENADQYVELKNIPIKDGEAEVSETAFAKKSEFETKLGITTDIGSSKKLSSAITDHLQKMEEEVDQWMGTEWNDPEHGVNKAMQKNTQRIFSAEQQLQASGKESTEVPFNFGDGRAEELTGRIMKGKITVLRSRSKEFIIHGKAVAGQGAFGKLHITSSRILKKFGVIKSADLKKVDDVKHNHETEMLMRYKNTEGMIHSHEVTVKVKDPDTDKIVVKVGVVTEFCAGGSLQDKMDNAKNEGKSIFSKGQEKACANAFLPLAKGMKEAHANGDIHRDIKPGNIVIKQQEGLELKLIDFGEMYDGRAKEGQKPCELVGTPYYMAPEVARATPGAEGIEKQEYGPKVDVFSLGTVVYEMLYGVGKRDHGISTSKHPFSFINMIGGLEKKKSGVSTEEVDLVDEEEDWGYEDDPDDDMIDYDALVLENKQKAGLEQLKENEPVKSDTKLSEFEKKAEEEPKTKEVEEDDWDLDEEPLEEAKPTIPEEPPREGPLYDLVDSMTNLKAEDRPTMAEVVAELERIAAE